MKSKIDLRSDTVTKPSLAMRQAIAEAKVGDDVMGEDPTVNRLEAYASQLLGKEAALFVTSGTQGNLLSLLAHCGRGDACISGYESHIYQWETGGSAALGGIHPRPFAFEKDGTLDLQKIAALIKPEDCHFAKEKLLALENTYWGRALPLKYLQEIPAFARKHQLKTHLDGARLFNAAIASSVPVKDIAQHFDSVTFCLSKGLGAPVGSMICGTKEFIANVRRLRKMVGSGMRQAGILAAAGLFALENNVTRLKEDHDNATYLAQRLSKIPSLQGKVEVHTNMVFMKAGPERLTALPRFLESKGVIIWGEDPIRLVTHLDVNRADMDIVANTFYEFYNS